MSNIHRRSPGTRVASSATSSPIDSHNDQPTEATLWWPISLRLSYKASVGEAASRFRSWPESTGRKRSLRCGNKGTEITLRIELTPGRTSIAGRLSEIQLAVSVASSDESEEAGTRCASCACQGMALSCCHMWTATEVRSERRILRCLGASDGIE